MPPTMNGKKASDNQPGPKVYRPGQRQQERMQRLARRQKRQRIILASMAAVLLVAAGIAGAVWYQNYNAQLAIAANNHATATANANATSIATNCFINPSGPKVPAIYAGTATPNAGPSSSPELSGTPTKLQGGLQYVDIITGKGPAAKSGSNISVEYTGWVASTCTKFDSSYDGSSGTPGTPFTVALGQGQVIPGWDQGLVGIQAGGIRRLFIPAALAYGSSGQGSIPPNADLIFDVTALSVK